MHTNLLFIYEVRFGFTSFTHIGVFIYLAYELCSLYSVLNRSVNLP